MTSYSRIFYPLIYVLLFLTWSCQKEPGVYPVVEFLQPSGIPHLQYGDTLEIVVRSRQADPGIQLRVLDGERALPFGIRLKDKSAETYTYQLIYNDRYLESGLYDLKVTAYNQEREAHDYARIQISALEKRATGILVLSEVAGKSVLSYIDSSGQAGSLNFNGLYDFLAVSSYDGLALLAATFDHPLKGFEWLPLRESFEQPLPAAAGAAQYSAAFTGPKWSYVLETAGQLKAFDRSGSVKVAFELPPGQKPLNACWFADGVLLASQVLAKESYRLFLLEAINGHELKMATVPARPIDLIAIDDERALILARSGADTEIYLYNLRTNQLSKRGQLNGELPMDVTLISANLAIFSTDQNIYQLNLLSFLGPDQLHSFAAASLAYDDTEGRLYYSQGSALTTAAPGEIPQLHYLADGPITDFEIIYNK